MEALIFFYLHIQGEPQLKLGSKSRSEIHWQVRQS